MYQLRVQPQSGYMDRGALDRLVLRVPAITAPFVVKSHDVGPAALAALRAGHCRAVFTYRDPRDCVVSDMLFMNHSFETAVKRIQASLEPLSLLRTIPHVLMVGYEEMMADPRRQIHRIACHLGMPLDEPTIIAIDDQTSIETSKSICASLKHQDATRVYHSPVHHHRIDTVTHLHDNHINGGTIGRWKDELSIDRAILLTELFLPWLLKLGYETATAGLLKTSVAAQSSEFARFANAS